MEVNLSELGNPKVKPKMVAYETFLGFILSSLERAVDYIIMAKWRGVFRCFGCVRSYLKTRRNAISTSFAHKCANFIGVL